MMGHHRQQPAPHAGNNYTHGGGGGGNQAHRHAGATGYILDVSQLRQVTLLKYSMYGYKIFTV